MKNVVLLLVFLGILVSPVWGDSVKGGVDFHSLVTDHYSFSPSKLTKEERESIPRS